MATKRTRDDVWEKALNRVVLDEEQVVPDELVEATEASERTVREVLSVMASTPYLERCVMDDGSVQYQAGQILTEE